MCTDASLQANIMFFVFDLALRYPVSSLDNIIPGKLVKMGGKEKMSKIGKQFPLLF